MFVLLTALGEEPSKLVPSFPQPSSGASFAFAKCACYTFTVIITAVSMMTTH